jgi:hypothetical protein
LNNILFKVGYVGFRIILFFTFNLNHKIYMDIYFIFLKYLGTNLPGKPRYIDYSVKFDSTDHYSLITLCENCVITGSTILLTHDYTIWHAAVGIGRISKKDPEFKLKGSIVVGENAFIGTNCIILPGVEIGRNAIVGAGSVVTKNVPENTIVAGNPAKKIGELSGYVDKYFLTTNTSDKLKYLDLCE